MTIQRITPARAHALAGLLSSLAAERKFFFRTRPFDADDIENDLTLMECQGIHDWGAFEDNGLLVGWATIRPERNQFEGFHHCGRLSMGVRKGYRGMGYGRRLLQAALDDTGFSRVELDVMGSNSNAIALYSSLGFVHEGRKVNARILDGVYDDIVLMARTSPFTR